MSKIRQTIEVEAKDLAESSQKAALLEQLSTLKLESLRTLVDFGKGSKDPDKLVSKLKTFKGLI